MLTNAFNPRGLSALPLLLSAFVALATIAPAQAQDVPADVAVSQPTTQPTSQPTAVIPIDPTEPSATEPTAEMIQVRISQVQAAGDLPEAMKNEIVSLYNQALEQVSAAQTWANKIADLQKGRDEASAILKETRERLAGAQSKPAEEYTPSGELAELTEELNRENSQLKNYQDAAKALEDEAKGRVDRQAAIPVLRADAIRRLEKLNKDIEAPTLPAGAGPRWTMARRTLDLARKRSLDLEIRAYEEELQFFTARTPVLNARRELAQLLVAEAKSRVAKCESIVDRRRREEVERQSKQAERDLSQVHSALQQEAEQNSELTTESQSIKKKISATQAKATKIAATISELAKDFEFLQRSMKMTARSDVSKLMRRLRSDLSRYRSQEMETRNTQNEYAQVTIRLADLGDELANLPGRKDKVLKRLKESNRGEIDKLTAATESLFAARRTTLELLTDSYNAYQMSLAELLKQEAAVPAKVEEYSEFVDQNILWITSRPIHQEPLPSKLFSGSPDSPTSKFPELAKAVWDDFYDSPGLYLIDVLIIGVLLLVRPRLRAFLKIAGERVSRARTDSYSLTIESLLATILIALPWPTVFLLAGRSLRSNSAIENHEVFTLAQMISSGLQMAAITLLTLSILRQICRVKGLGESHFRWDPAATRLARHLLPWLMWTAAPLVFFVTAAEGNPDFAWGDSIGRYAFILTMLLLAFFIRQAMRPESGFPARRLRTNQGGWFFRLRHVWYFGSVAAPLFLALASAAGYHFAAIQLFLRLVITFWIGIGLLIAHDMMARWIVFAQRKLALEQAKKKAEQQKEKAEQDESGSTKPPVIDEEKIDLIDLGDQSRRLLRALVVFGLLIGLWATWTDLLPALSFMEDVRLWSYHGATDGAENATQDEGVAKVVLKYVTLQHVFAAALIAFATTILARNIPGLLEIVILQRLPLDAGSRFAMTTLARYAIMIVGMVVAFGAIGVGWSSVQWLAAAVTVGLGFGLQEIFANFVSGLILLFERPIRIGDVVTVGNVTGTVHKIRMRATTIIDWDRKELVIPNKEFITGQINNWYLSDRILRLVIPVGIAYGSDTNRARELLLDAARHNKRVLDEPCPQAYFLSFGASSLDFELRVYVQDIDDWIQTKNELHFAIDDAFRAANIEIAFPQQDVHIRSIKDALPILDGRRPTSGEKPEAG